MINVTPNVIGSVLKYFGGADAVSLHLTRDLPPDMRGPVGMPSDVVWDVGYSASMGPWKVAPPTLVAAMVANEKRSAGSPKYLTTVANGFYIYYTQDIRHPSWYQFFATATYAYEASDPYWGGTGGIAELTPGGWVITYGPSGDGTCVAPHTPKAVMSDIFGCTGAMFG